MKVSRLLDARSCTRAGTATAALAAATLATWTLTAAGESASAAPAARTASAPVSATVRVEGVNHTLLATTKVATTAQSIDPDGKPSDTCTGDTAAVALQDATHGRWTAGAYSASLGYPVVGILGESHPFTSPYYWSLWIDGKPATTGICGAKLHAGESLLFFPQCSETKASKCPNGLFNPPVLRVTAPRRVAAGKPFTVKVVELNNASGKPSPVLGATFAVGGERFATDLQGTMVVENAAAGTYHVTVTAPGAIRDEFTVTVA